MKSVLVVASILVMSLTASQASAWSERELTNEALRGTLTLPDGEASVPAVLILAGSGPVDRDGNLPGVRNDSLKMLAHGLADQGIASLRVDKRGIGGSAVAGLREEDLRFDTYVSDATSWAELLGKQSRVARVVLAGHSEGALIATLAAQRTSVAGLVLIAGTGERIDATIDRQLMAAKVPDELQQASRRITEQLKQGKPVTDVPAALMSIYRPSVQNYMMSWLTLDPVAELRKVRGPVLIIQGSTDFQVLVDDAKHLSEARPEAKLLVIDGMNHVLKPAPADRAGNIATYKDPTLALSAPLVPAIASFVKGL